VLLYWWWYCWASPGCTYQRRWNMCMQSMGQSHTSCPSAQTPCKCGLCVGGMIVFQSNANIKAPQTSGIGRQ
jgi:hypothetical protein